MTTAPAPSPALTLGPIESLCTDHANGERLAKRHGDCIRYVPGWGWLVYDGQRWNRDDTGALMRYAWATARSIYGEAKQAHSDPEAKKLSRWATISLSNNRLQAMIEQARAQPGIVAQPDTFDRDPYLLNLTNGTLDLRPAEPVLMPHCASDFITHIAGTGYEVYESCHTWEQFIHRIMDGDSELIAFLRRAVGYTLIADTSEQALFFCYGGGENGKSVFMQVFERLMGTNARRVRAESLMSHKHDNIPNDIARLAGVRLVIASEIEKGKRLNEGLIKDLTGQDIITARFLRQEFFEFRPMFKLWLYGNHKPIIRGADRGIWRRVLLIPFTVTIPKAEQDKNLAAKLIEELPGILNWAIRGYLDWREHGLNPPAAVQSATSTYRDEMDDLAEWLGTRCLVGANLKAYMTELYKDYSAWCMSASETPVSKKAFGNMLEERGFLPGRDTAGRFRTGLTLRP